MGEGCERRKWRVMTVPYFFLERYNLKSGMWENVRVFVADPESKAPDKKYLEVDLFPWNGEHDLFDRLTSGEISGVNEALPPDASKAIKEEWERFCVPYDRDRYPRPQVYTVWVSSLIIDLLQTPKVPDYENVDAEKTNPVALLLSEIRTFISIYSRAKLYNAEDDEYLYRLIFWLA